MMKFPNEKILRDPVTVLAGSGILGGLVGGVLKKKQDKDAAKAAESAAAINAKTAAAESGTPQVANEKDTAAARIGRAALISTSPLGVQTTDPTGRRKLLGNV